MRRVALGLALLLSLPALSGCLDLDAARVPDRLLEGRGGNGWAKNQSASQKEPVSQGALAKAQGLVYEDRQSSAGYPGTLAVLTLRALVKPSEDDLRSTTQQRIRAEVESRGAKIGGGPATGTRALANGADAYWFTYNGTVEQAGIFSRSAQVRVFGEVWQCPGGRTVVITVGMAQTTDVRTVSGIPISDDPDDTTWREIVADPSGKIQGIRGSSGLAYNVEC